MVPIDSTHSASVFIAPWVTLLLSVGPAAQPVLKAGPKAPGLYELQL